MSLSPGSASNSALSVSTSSAVDIRRDVPCSTMSKTCCQSLIRPQQLSVSPVHRSAIATTLFPRYIHPPPPHFVQFRPSVLKISFTLCSTRLTLRAQLYLGCVMVFHPQFFIAICNYISGVACHLLNTSQVFPA